MSEIKRVEVVGLSISGQVVLMDLEDYLRVRHLKINVYWSTASKQHYVAIANRKQLNLPTPGLHRYILMLRGHDLTNLKVDFKNYNTLDLRYSNLKIVTNGQVRTYSRNEINKAKKRHPNSSIYVGVYKEKRFRKDGKIWVACINRNRNKIFLGNYHTEIEAAYAFNLATQKLSGEHARLNPVTEQMVIDAKNAYNSSQKA